MAELNYVGLSAQLVGSLTQMVTNSLDEQSVRQLTPQMFANFTVQHFNHMQELNKKVERWKELAFKLKSGELTLDRVVISEDDWEELPARPARPSKETVAKVAEEIAHAQSS